MSTRFPFGRLLNRFLPLFILAAIALWPGGLPIVVVVGVTIICVALTELLETGGGHAVGELSQVDAVNRSLGVLELSTDGTMLHANAKFLEIMGYELDELVGQHHSILVDEQMIKSTEYEQFWQSLRDGNFQVSKYRRMAKDGSERWVNASYNPVLRPFGSPKKIVKLVTDVSREQELAKDNGMIRRALDCSTSNVMIADTEFRVSYLNESATAMFSGMESNLRTELPNFRAKDILNSKIDIFHTDPAHQHHMLSALQSTHSTDIAIGGHTIRIVASPVFDHDNQRLGTVVDWTDRTQEVKTELEMEDVVEKASAGQLDARIALDGKTGSMLRLSEGVNELLDMAQNVIQDTMRVFAAMAEGDLSKTIDGEYKGDFDQLKHDANKTVAVLVDVVKKITNAVEPVRSGALEISQSNLDLSKRTENQAASLEKTAASMEQITATVRRNAENASEADSMAHTTREEAQQGGEVVQRAVQAMSQINASSEKIAAIVGVIDEIAFQTNLLALNAAVEAARAGDQGRGFAVVANEVRNLAGRSASSAREIKDLISDSERKVQEGSRMVDESGEVLGRIVERVHSVTDIVGEIASASREQTGGIDEVNRSIMQMDKVTQQNAAMVEEAAAASSRMDDQATALQQLVEFFSIEPSRTERRGDQRPWTTTASSEKNDSGQTNTRKTA